MIPLNDRVMVKRDEAVTETEGGIFIPDKAREKTKSGVIHAISEKVVPRTGLKVGDRVFFGQYCGTEIVLPEGEFLMLREEDIVAVEEKPKAMAAR